MPKKKSKAMKKKEEEEQVVEEEEVGDASTSSSEADEGGEASDGESSSDDGDVEGEQSSSGSEQDDDEDGSGDDASGSSSDEEEDAMEEDEPAAANRSTPSHNDDGEEQCTFDLANLLAFNTHQINSAELYQQKGKAAASKNKEWYATTPTIAATSTNVQMPNVSESFLLSKAAEGTTQLLKELWKLPTEKTDVGLMAKLPSAETKLPRSLPPPPPKQLTKWEQFALQRGIAPKSKRSRKVFDEATGEWKHLTGSLENRANAGPESWPIIEVKKNDDPMADPWEKLREERKGRVSKNVEARMRNAERAGVLERGSANRLVKNNKRLEKQREIGREKELKRGLVAPVGVPLDMKSGDPTGAPKRGKPSTQLALKATQTSTASLGRFDKQREGEPEKQFSKSIHSKKRKQQLIEADGGGGTNKKFLQSEAQKSSDILNKVMNGTSSKEKERDVKKGRYAKGETAYDYEFDDGLGSGSFKKKKGRAGMGKMKKVTKKRIK